MAVASALAAAQNTSLEYAVKATYLVKFAPFVEWPMSSFGSPLDPLLLCVVDTDQVGILSDEAASGKSVAGHPIIVRHISGASARDSKCHIMYVAPSQREPAAAILDSVRGTPVLTVTDAARDSRSKGIINFVTQDNRIRFEIDLQTASENRIEISSKLLDLAARVRPKS